MPQIDKYLKVIKRCTPLSKKDERELFIKAKNGDQKAYNDIINANLRFVVSVARQYEGKGLPLSDLIQEGNLGLLRAYQKFDVTKNFKFITYAVWWIKQAITSALYENANIVHLPANKINNITKTNRLKNELEQEFSKPLSLEELADYLEDPSIIEDMQYASGILEIDKTYTDNLKDLNEVLTDNDSSNNKIELLKDELETIMKDFSEREKNILYSYYGINEIRSYTLKEIGYDIGLTRERVRQIKKQILEKLKDKKYADKLRTYL